MGVGWGGAVENERTGLGGSENPKELTLGWGRVAEVEDWAEQIKPMLDTATIGCVKRRKNHVSLEPITQAHRSNETASKNGLQPGLCPAPESES